MKTIGLIGGMSWESTAVYYQLLNRMARQRLGGLHSAQLLMWSFDFAQIESLQATGDWDAATQAMVDAARRVERGGAECLVICTNTMHKMADEVRGAVDIPLIHIVDVAAAAIKASAAKQPLLLATRYTMEQDFYTGRLRDRHNIRIHLPDPDDRRLVNDVIYRELCQGVVSDRSRQRFLGVIGKAVRAGADSVIFGCTEVGLLLSQADLQVPVFDTTELHAAAALDFATG